jgi:hypothetical protein
MPLPITELTQGDRVVLNCPRGAPQTKRDAVFKGILRTREELRELLAHATVQFEINLDFLEAGVAVAAFLMHTGNSADFEYPGGGKMIPEFPPFDGQQVMLVQIDAEGNLREEGGHRVWIERRLRMGMG